jgi:hypothetical protein
MEVIINNAASASQITKLITQEPRWDKDANVFKMNFFGQAKMPSVNNTILHL